MSVMGCLHDPANVQQTSSKCIQNRPTRANRDVVSAETSRSRDGLVTISSRTKSSTSWSRLGLGAICLGLGLVGLVSGLGPLRLVETFSAGARRVL